MIFIDLTALGDHTESAVKYAWHSIQKQDLLIFTHSQDNPEKLAEALGFPIVNARFYRLPIWDAIKQALEERNREAAKEGIPHNPKSFNRAVAVTNEKPADSFGVQVLKAPDCWPILADQIIPLETDLLKLNREHARVMRGLSL